MGSNPGLLCGFNVDSIDGLNIEVRRLGVRAVDSRSRGREFKSQRHILNGKLLQNNLKESGENKSSQMGQTAQNLFFNGLKSKVKVAK